MRHGHGVGGDAGVCLSSCVCVNCACGALDGRGFGVCQGRGKGDEREREMGPHL